MGTLAATKVVPLYAGFWRRGAASFVDGLVLFVPNFAIGLAMPGSPGSAFLVQLVVDAIYYALMHSSEGQATLGKRAFGIKVTGLDGGRIGVGRAFGRYAGFVLSSIILGLGLLIAAFTGRKQALHDMMCGTLVVNREATPEEVVAGGDTMPVTGGVWAVIAFFLIIPFFGGILAAIAIPAYQDYVTRAKVAEVIAASAPLRQQIEQAHAQNRPLPVGPAQVASRHARSVKVTERGEVILVVAAPVIEQGRIVWTPTDEGGTVSWKCTGEDIAPRYLPVACRH